MSTAVDDDLSSFEAVLVRMRWYHRVEVELFHTLGRWAAQPDGATLRPGARVLLGTQARLHAWHGELWRGQFPTAGQALAEEAMTGFDARSVLFPGAAGAHTAGHPEDSIDLDEGIETVYGQVLPHLGELYERHLDAASPMTDGPIMRVLTLVLASRSTWTRRPS